MSNAFGNLAGQETTSLVEGHNLTGDIDWISVGISGVIGNRVAKELNTEYLYSGEARSGPVYTEINKPPAPTVGNAIGAGVATGGVDTMAQFFYNGLRSWVG